MRGFIKYVAKLLIIFVIFTNTFPTAVFASTLSQQPLTQASAQDAQTQNAPVPQLPMDPVTPLPQTSHSFLAGASVLGLSTDDGDTALSAHPRRGVRVQKLFKKDFRADETINLTLDNPDQESYKTKVIDANGKEASVKVQTEVQNGVTQLEVIPTNQFQPGKYTIKVTDETGQTTSQDFSWGVLALNPDKAVYAPNETGDLSMAVLDDKGAMVCDAEVQLQITNPAFGINDTLSTENGKIKVNSECNSHAFTLKPDYEAHYALAGEGTYDLTLTAKTGNGTHIITDTILVQQQTPFVVQRTSATRIYPPNTYPMQLNITAQHDFTGTITETVPDSFAITQADNHKSYDSMKTVYLNNNDPSVAVSKQVLGASDGLVMPFDGTFPITQGFGTQLTDPTLQAFYNHYGLGGHDGIDFGLPMGTPLYAVDDGKVTWSGPGDYGTMVTIKHSWGQTYYGHMSKTSVNVGDDIHKGSLIGYSGMSGEATGPHLHFGMKPDNPDMSNGYYGKIDPMPYLPIGKGQQGTGIRDLIQSTGLPSVLGASTSAAASQSAEKITPTLVPTVTPETTTATSSANFTIGDSISQQSSEDQPQTMAKTKVLKWHVSMKKGDNIKLAYNYKTPQISPQFYLMGSVKFYSDQNKALTYDEGRQWEIAADDIGTGWYHPNGSSNVGYEWQYRKKLTIDHTKLGTLSSKPILDHTSTSNNTLNANLTWSHITSAGLTDSILVVAIGSDNTGAKAVNTVTYGAASLTQVPGATINFSSGAVAGAEIWYVLNPPAGTANITVHYASSMVGNVAGAATFSNVNQTTPFGTVATSTGSSSTPSISVGSTNTNQVVIESQGNNGGTSTVTGGQTLIGNSGQGAASYKNATSGTTAISWSLSGSGAWAEVAAAINGESSIPTQTNFPVLVSRTDADLQSHAQSSGNDIVFADATGMTKLNSEVESYNSTTGALNAWVNVPSISNTTDTNIYMYYGNPSIGSQSSTSTWSSNFRMVHHFGTLFNGNSQSCPYNDSTSNGFNFTCTGTTNITGKIDNARSFNGTSDSMSASPNIDDSVTTGFTASGWFNTTTNASGNATIMRNDGSSGNTLNSKGFFLKRNANRLNGAIWANGATRTVNGSTTAIAANTWYYGALTYDGTNITLYINGTVEATNTTTGSIGLSTVNLTAGSSAATNFFSGALDELRVQDAVRDSSWIMTEYNNQNSPSTFIPTIGSEETKVYSTTNDMLMRHGKFFDTSSNNYGKQPFLF